MESFLILKSYKNKIIIGIHEPKNIKFATDENLFKIFTLAGLIQCYIPMNMGIWNTGMTISADIIKQRSYGKLNTLIVQFSSEGKGLFSKKKTQRKLLGNLNVLLQQAWIFS